MLVCGAATKSSRRRHPLPHNNHGGVGGIGKTDHGGRSDDRSRFATTENQRNRISSNTQKKRTTEETRSSESTRNATQRNATQRNAHTLRHDVDTLTRWPPITSDNDVGVADIDAHQVADIITSYVKKAMIGYHRKANELKRFETSMVFYSFSKTLWLSVA